MPPWAERFFQELHAAPSKGEAQQVLESYAETIAALDEATSAQIRTKAQDIIRGLPD
jgi:hypothetical protein